MSAIENGQDQKGFAKENLHKHALIDVYATHLRCTFFCIELSRTLHLIFECLGYLVSRASAQYLNPLLAIVSVITLQVYYKYFPNDIRETHSCLHHSKSVLAYFWNLVQAMTV